MDAPAWASSYLCSLFVNTNLDYASSVTDGRYIDGEDRIEDTLRYVGEAVIRESVSSGSIHLKATGGPGFSADLCYSSKNGHLLHLVAMPLYHKDSHFPKVIYSMVYIGGTSFLVGTIARSSTHEKLTVLFIFYYSLTCSGVSPSILRCCLH